jgi:5'-nucleotidase
LRKTSLRALGLAGALAVGGATVLVGGNPAAAAPTTIQILGFNDFHGRLESPGNTADGKPIGGAAQMAGMIKQLRGENPNTLLVAAGDNIGASPFVSAIQQDAPTLDFLNAIDLDASSVGNHEFDRGFADLTGRVTDRAEFEYLGANVYKGDAPALPESFTRTIDGVKVGVVGVVTEETPTLVSPDGVAGLTFKDPVTEANRVAAKLKAEGAAVVVLLIHEGGPTGGSDAANCAAIANPSTVFGKIVTNTSKDVNAIISAHTHQQYNCSYPVAGLGHPRPVMQTGNYGSALDKLSVTVDGGAVTAVAAELLPIVGYPQDPEIAALVAAAKTEADKLGLNELGRITADIKRATNAAGEEDRGAESVLGNFIADVQLARTKDTGRGGAQIALMNPGGLRADLLFGADNGVVTYAEAFAVQPFANDVVTQTFTGAQIKTALEQQWQPAGASRPILHLGISKGLKYTYNPDAAAGNRIVTMTFNGQPLSLTGTYRVTTNTFLAQGGDNFTVLAQGTNRTTTGDNDLTMLVDYFEANSPITADTVFRSSVAGTGGPGEPSPSPSGSGSASPSASASASASAGPNPPGNGGGLPRTGVAITSYVIGGLLLIALGVAALVASRRRRVQAAG